MTNQELDRLKQDRDVAIMAHYYVDGEIQDMADYVGDSFFLAQKALEIEAQNIIMAGVSFMGESIKILNPDKTVYLPDQEADCPMAHMVTLEKIQEMREAYEDLAVVCYVNSTAEIKAHSDYCCTSANAVKVLSAIEAKNIFFIPDGNLGANISGFFPDKNIICNDGACPVHHEVTLDQVKSLRQAHPGAKVLAHPECRPEIMEFVDYKGSTSGILKAVEDLGGDEFIVLTEEGIAWKLQKTYPDKTFIFNDMVCQGMKQVKKEDILRIIEEGGPEVTLDEDLRIAARKPLERMLEVCASPQKALV
ncbi:MAG: quinolinate synthase NadA [Tissierellia bacterium]|nr:quinolinate synthase NadA [Tissierellia bacterium]